jgi:hypothetical protein
MTPARKLPLKCPPWPIVLALTHAARRPLLILMGSIGRSRQSQSILDTGPLEWHYSFVEQ